jgi:EAL domain-containing protein (putative c-di-GMP-specific phosphodiesterase class I)
VVGLLDRLRERGARICLDDVHGSEADLHRLVTLCPDLVKVARRLVAGCDTRPAQVARITRLLSFARAHRITVCAEGVETAEELVTLHGLGVELVQGFLLGRPQSQWVEPLLPSARVGQQRGQRPWPPVNAGSVR